ncbi:MAG: hypothetical protein IT509_11860 [Rhodocyclaceae bacterium]|nr:hypothetical protein [Rhodocyclaceae bacterium]
MDAMAARLDELIAALAGCAAGDEAVQRLRRDYPGLKVTGCDARDLCGEQPYARVGEHDLYLVDTSDHCWRVTGDPARAGGLLIASHGARS